MAKTELTKKIEKYLRSSYSPAELGGVRINKMRPSFVGLEVPVECGSVKEGLVDAVRIDECLLNETRTHRCFLLKSKNQDLYDMAANHNGCPYARDDTAGMESCTRTDCRFMSTIKSANEGILITTFEIKVSVSDFHSQHGHNFCGNCNYYVVPVDIYPKIKDAVPDDVGILVFYDAQATGGSYYGIRKKKECLYRALPPERQLWLVMSTMKRVVKGKNQEIDDILAGTQSAGNPHYDDCL